MDLALHDPQDGYYADAGRIGPTGDFVTASDVGRDFGRCMARFLADVDRRAGPFDPFDVLEFGAGRGLLARDVLDALPTVDGSLAQRLRYRLVERSAAMREAGRRAVPEAEALAWGTPGGGYTGCVLAVELFDALPVHRLRRRGGRLVEVFVDQDAETGEFVEREGLPCPPAQALAERYGAARDEGTEAEVATAAKDVMDAMAGALERGVLVVVDYGDLAERLYGALRPQGTLLAYRGHTTSGRLLDHVGQQDLTAHVNFSQLEDLARSRGLMPLGFTTQDRFLIASGILEGFEPLAGGSLNDPGRIKRRLQALQLIHPEGMGRRFKVQVFWKGGPPSPALAALVDPFTRQS